jgi:putative hydrolase of the HAD superfamily
MFNRALLTRYIHPMEPIPTGQIFKGKLEVPIHCILFDVYGTLFVSRSGDIHSARNRSGKLENLQGLLKKYSIDLEAETILEDFFSTVRSIHRTMQAAGVDYPEIEIDKVWMQVLDRNDTDSVRAFAMEFEFLLNPVFPMPHARELIDTCSARAIRMGIISNAQFFTPLLFDIFWQSDLEQLGFHPDLIFYSYEYGYAKPSFFLFEAASDSLGQHGIPLENTLYVGNDMLNDIYPAHAAGFKTALFAGDKRSLRLRVDEPRCSSLTPDLVITDLMQLQGFLKNLQKKNS